VPKTHIAETLTLAALLAFSSSSKAGDEFKPIWELPAEPEFTIRRTNFTCSPGGRLLEANWNVYTPNGLITAKTLPHEKTFLTEIDLHEIPGLTQDSDLVTNIELGLDPLIGDARAICKRSKIKWPPRLRTNMLKPA
jgi:hypothetical protein